MQRKSCERWPARFFIVKDALEDDIVNDSAGKYLGKKLTGSPRNRWIQREHLDRTHAFFDRYGPKDIVSARFVPIVRTFPLRRRHGHNGLGRVSLLQHCRWSPAGRL